MSEFEADVLFDNLEAVHAYRILHDPQVAGELTAEMTLDLCLKAGYSEEASQKAATQRALDRQRRDQPA